MRTLMLMFFMTTVITQNGIAQQKTPNLILKTNAALFFGKTQFFIEQRLGGQYAGQLGLRLIDRGNTEGFELTPELRKYKQGTALRGSYVALFGQLKYENTLETQFDITAPAFEANTKQASLGMLWGIQGILFKTLTFDAYFGPKIKYTQESVKQFGTPLPIEEDNGFGIGLRAGISVGIPLVWTRK